MLITPPQSVPMTSVLLLVVVVTLDYDGTCANYHIYYNIYCEIRIIGYFIIVNEPNLHQNSKLRLWYPIIYNINYDNHNLSSLSSSSIILLSSPSQVAARWPWHLHPGYFLLAVRCLPYSMPRKLAPPSWSSPPPSSWLGASSF